MLRFDHVGVVVSDLEAATVFFLGIGFELEGRTSVEGEVVDRLNGLDGVRSDIVMLRAPGGGSQLELCRYNAHPDADGPRPWPANTLGYRHICVQIDDVDGHVERLRGAGHDLVGDVEDLGTWKLVYVRGPEGVIVELAERVAQTTAS